MSCKTIFDILEILNRLERTYELDSLDGLFSYRLTIVVEHLPYKPSKMRLLGHLFMALSKIGALVEIFFFNVCESK